MPSSIPNIAFIGCGHIGSSILLSLERNHSADRVIVVEKNPEYRKILDDWSIVDHCQSSIDSKLSDVDLVIICTHLSSYVAICQDLAPYLKDGAIVTDVGSNKVYARDVMEVHLPDHVHIVPGHPVAGSEGSGPEAGSSRMFNDRYVILTPREDCDKNAVETVAEFWRSFEAKVAIMTPLHHDRVLAMTSHIPHLLAYALVGSASTLEASLKRENVSEENQVMTHEVIKYSAGGFRDSTRIAASNPEMWCDVFLHNRQAILEMSSRFTEELMALQKIIRNGDRDKLKALFTEGRNIRDRIVNLNQAGHFSPHEFRDAFSDSGETIKQKKQNKKQ